MTKQNIGLLTATLLANKGFQVHGVDVVQSTIDTKLKYNEFTSLNIKKINRLLTFVGHLNK